MDRRADLIVGTAAADVAVERFINICIGWSRGAREQGDRSQNLARLAVAALRNVYLQPRALHGMADVARKTFYGGDALARQASRRGNARPGWMPIHQDCTRSTHRDTAAELGAREMESVAQDPEQRNVRSGVDHVRFAVDLKRNVSHICPRRPPIPTLSAWP